jgi:hypothetical protein
MNSQRSEFELDYPLQGTYLDMSTREALSLAPPDRRRYVELLLEQMKLEIQNDRFWLKPAVALCDEMRALEQLALRAPDYHVVTDDVFGNRDALETGTPAHSEHRWHSRKVMWQMATKQGSLKNDVMSGKVAARIEALLDGRKSTFTEGREDSSALKMIYAHLGTHYSLNCAFPPFHARFLADRYLPRDRDSVVVDPSAGFGGRLLGTIFVPRKHHISYIGVDPNTKNQAAYAMLAARHEFFRQEKYRDVNAPRSAVVHPMQFEKWILTDDAKALTGQVDLVMTSPPYGSTENYDPDSTAQSANAYPSYEEWRDSFLRPLVHGAWKLLRPSGIFILNVASTDEAPRLNQDCRRLAREIGFRWHSYYRLLMPLPPGVKTHAPVARRASGENRGRHITVVNGTPWKHEPVLVWQKSGEHNAV